MFMNPVMAMANLANIFPAFNQMPNNNQAQVPNQFSLTFTLDDGRNTMIIIPCQPNETMAEIIQRFWGKVAPNGQSDPNAKFIHNAKNINQSLTLAESGLTNGAIIQVLISGRVKGAKWLFFK